VTISPCIKLCILDAGSGFCEGCGRSIEEIAGWSAFGDDRRRSVMAALPDRLARLGDVRHAPLHRPEAVPLLGTDTP
jgi:predicted Fe-S protein YdhL (DUF1289 family)